MKTLVVIITAMLAVLSIPAFALSNSISFSQSTTNLSMGHFTTKDTDTIVTNTVKNIAQDSLTGVSASKSLSHDVTTSSKVMKGSASLTGSSQGVSVSNGLFTIGHTVSNQKMSQFVTSGNMTDSSIGKSVTLTGGAIAGGFDGAFNAGVAGSSAIENYSNVSKYTIDKGTLVSQSFTSTDSIN